MANLGGLLGALGAPTMEMGGQTMVGRHGGFTMHGPMLMAGENDPNTNISYGPNPPPLLDTPLQFEKKGGEGKSQNYPLPPVPHALSSQVFRGFQGLRE